MSAALFCVFLRDPVGPFSKDVNKASPSVPRPSDKTGYYNIYLYDKYTTKAKKIICLMEISLNGDFQ